MSFFKSIVSVAAICCLTIQSVYAKDIPVVLSTDGRRLTIQDLAARELYAYGIIENTGYLGVDIALLENSSIYNFESKESFSRLDACNLIYKLCADKSVFLNKLPFVDVPDAYSDVISLLYSYNIVSGISFISFGMGDCSLQQFCAMILRYMGENFIYDDAVQIAEEKGLLKFLDIQAGIFTKGDAYLIVSNLLKLETKDKVNGKFITYKDLILDSNFEIRQMLRPKSVDLIVDSYDDFFDKFNYVFNFIPDSISIKFTDSCSFDDKFLIYEYFLKNIYSWYGLFDDFIKLTHVDFLYGSSPYVSYSTNDDYSTPFLNLDNILYDDVTLYDMYMQDVDKFLNNFDGSVILLDFYNYNDFVYLNFDLTDWLICYEDFNMTERVKSVLSDIDKFKDMTDYEKVIAVGKYICEYADYDYDCLHEIESGNYNMYSDAHTLFGFLSDGLVVCDGYSKTYQWLLNYLGVDSVIIYGNSNVNGSFESHAWNKVKIDNNWYNVDLTWCDDNNSMSMDYMLKSDIYFKQYYHIMDDKFANVFSSFVNFN